MPGPFDTTTKYLVQTYVHDWLALLGFRVAGPGDLLDAELVTVSPLADRMIRLSAPVPRIVHIEFQSTHDRTMGQRLAEYNALLHGRHGLPVRSVIVLLRPSADGPALSGVLEWGTPGEPTDLTFSTRWHGSGSSR